MASHFNFYEVLNLDATESSSGLFDAIQSRLNELSAEGKPETNGEVQQLLIAAQVLGNDELRAEYDERLNDTYAPTMGPSELRSLATMGHFPDETTAMRSQEPVAVHAGPPSGPMVPIPPVRLAASAAPTGAQGPPSGPMPPMPPAGMPSPSQMGSGMPGGPVPPGTGLSALLGPAPGTVKGFFWTVFGIGAFSALNIIGNMLGLFLDSLGNDLFRWTGVGYWLLYFVVVVFILNATLRAHRMTSSILLGVLLIGISVQELTFIFFFLLGGGSTVTSMIGSLLMFGASVAAAILVMLPGSRQWFSPVAR